MKFCDKLPNLRKKNNLSQEQLSEKLGVSRQAVSKWESGSSYPDMEKMIQMCKILNCSLDELLDDGIIGKENKKALKTNNQDYLDEFLKFINNTVNMFVSMKLKDKIKCIFEMIFIAMGLFTIGLLFFLIFNNSISSILYLFPSKIYSFFIPLLNNLLSIFLIIIMFITWLYLFKNRYLNYYITIEDGNTNEKVIEKTIPEFRTNEKKEIIIIRDPIYTTFSFLKLLEKFVTLIAKIISLFISPFLLIVFVISIAISVFILTQIPHNIIFLWAFIVSLNSSIMIFLIFYYLITYLQNQTFNSKLIFKIFIVSTIGISVGAGLFTSKFFTFKFLGNNDLYQQSQIVIKNIDINDNTKLYFHLKNHYIFGNFYNPINYHIDNSIDNIRIEISRLNDWEVLVKENNNIYDFDIINKNYIKSYHIILNDLKNNQLRNYSSIQPVQVNIYLSEEIYKKILNNEMVSTYSQ